MLLKNGVKSVVIVEVENVVKKLDPTIVLTVETTVSFWSLVLLLLNKLPGLVE